MRTCAGWTRRELLRIGSLGLGAFGLGATGMGDLSLPQLLAAKGSDRPAFIRDKSVVLLFLQGGPPQIEFFDPKMDAPADIRSCTGSVSTRHAGIHFGGTFPKLAGMSDKISVVRSFGSGDGGHNQLPVLTGGSLTGGTMGAQYARLAGSNHPKTAMPSHSVIVPEAIQPELQLGEPTGPFTFRYIKENYVTAGTLGKQNEAFLLGGGSDLQSNLELSLPRDRFDDRRRLLAQLDQFKRRMDKTPAFNGADSVQRQAYEVLLKGITDAFDIGKEDPKTVAKYDTSHLFKMEDYHRDGRYYRGKRNQSRITNLLGKQMLLARRLCESGCGFVTVVDGCWDFHGDGNNPPTPIGMPALGPQVDHAVAAFLEDVEQRGLSDKILLLVTGEMGRSPKKGRDGGTGHWGQLTPLMVAGGGLNMGQVIGRTDANGGVATSNQYLPKHLLATVMQTIFDPSEARLVSGLPTEIAQVINSAPPIKELFG